MYSEKIPEQPEDTQEWTLPPFIPKRRLLCAPPAGQNVWPGQCCPRFAARSSETLKIDRECWFCRFADFHLTEPVALEVGICCYRR